MSPLAQSTLFQLLPIGAYRSDRDGTLLHANAALLRMNRYTSEAEMHAHLRNSSKDPYVDPLRRSQFLALLESSGQVTNFVSEMVRFKTGEHMWVREHAHVVRDDNGNARYYEGTVEDITEELAAQARLDQSEALLQNVLQTIPDRVWLKDLNGIYLTCNDAFAANMGVTPAEMVGTGDAQWLGEALAAGFLATDRLALQAGKAVVLEEDMPTLVGHSAGLFEIVKTPMFDSDGQVIGVLGMARDIQQRKNAETLLRTTRAELQATLNALPDLLFEFTAEGHYRAIHSQSQSEASMVLPAHYILNKRVTEVLPQDAADACLAALREAQDTGRSSGQQYSLVLAGGKQWFELSVVRKPTEPGEEERFIAIARDITERKVTEEAIQHLAFHDSLTGLPNRRLLTDRLHSALAASNRHRQHGAMMFLDLDHFKHLNDTYGHDVGDLMLQEVARRLQQNVRAIDTVARFGGDEFVVLIQALSTDAEGARNHATAVAHKILASLNAPYALNALQHITTPSIGIALFSGDAVAAHDILKHADIAMYQAKAQGRNTLVIYEPNMAATSVERAQTAP